MRFSIALLIVSMATGGCTRTVVHNLAHVDATRAPTTQTVPETGVYRVQVSDRRGRLYTVPGTARFLDRGTTVGFESGSAGLMYAIVGEDRILLRLPNATTYRWHLKEHRPTHLTRESQKALGVAADVAVVGAVGAALVGGGIATYRASDHCH
jgi:hypothetical protein